MKNNKQALKIVSLSVITLLYSSWASADDPVDINSGFPDVSYEYKDGKLQEKFGEFDSVTYTKTSLPKSCAAVSTAVLAQEKHKKQPSADIVGSWKMDEDNSVTSIGNDEESVMPSYFANIKSNGEITTYNFSDKEETCELISTDELDGNKLSFNENISTVDLTKVKVTNIDKQLAVINVLKETYKEEEESKSVEYVQASLYDSVNALPQKCDIDAHKPNAEESNDNPSANLVGNWQDKSQSLNSAGMTGQYYFVLTADGFMFNVSYEKFEQNEDCFVEFVGEVVGDTYSK